MNQGMLTTCQYITHISGRSYILSSSHSWLWSFAGDRNRVVSRAMAGRFNYLGGRGILGILYGIGSYSRI